MSENFGKYFYKFKKPKKIADFSLALTEIVKELNNKVKKNEFLGDRMLFFHDDDFFVIYDCFPKSHYHLLILFRDIRLKTFSDLSVEHIPMIRKKIDLAQRLIEHLKVQSREEFRNERPELEFQFGYHAIPSLKQVHLHVISKDFSTGPMKKPFHWNSFTTEFFVHPQVFIEMLERRGQVRLDGEKFKKIKFSKVLKCPRTEKEFYTVYDMKSYWIRKNKWEYIWSGKNNKRSRNRGRRGRGRRKN